MGLVALGLVHWGLRGSGVGGLGCRVWGLGPCPGNLRYHHSPRSRVNSKTMFSFFVSGDIWELRSFHTGFNSC